MRRIAAASLALVAALALVQPVRDALVEASPRTPLSSATGAEGLAGSVLAGSFRPLLLTYLWLRGDVLYGEGRDEECHEVYLLLHELYPRNTRARDFLGWFLAFNLKQKAPDPALGWRWAESGLDMLLPSPEGPSIVADWIRKQCGQNSLGIVRYAGPAWEQERAWRARLVGFAARHYGEELSRFAAGLRVLEGRRGFGDRTRRALLLCSLAYEEMLRYGEAAHGAEATLALKEMADATADEPDLNAYFREKARCLEAVTAGRVPEPLPVSEAYPVAMALWGKGAREGDAQAIAHARTILAGLGEESFPEEVDLLRRWHAHMASGDPSSPPMPFDGMR